MSFCQVISKVLQLFIVHDLKRGFPFNLEKLKFNQNLKKTIKVKIEVSKDGFCNQFVEN